ncbi:STAS domain-containing protein [Mycolicibacterium thermoresistibile]
MNERREPAGEGTPAAGSTNCVVTEQWEGEIAVVTAAGVVDMLSAPQLDEAIRTALGKGPRALVVDFTAVDFLASAGMGVLVAIHDEVAPAVKLAIVAEGPATSRPLKLLGIADIVPLHATLDEALSALTA